MVEYAHAFREGTYRRRTALAASARRRGCVPLPRSASRGLACNGIRCAAASPHASDVAATTSAIDEVGAVAHRAADASDAPGRSNRLPCRFLLFLSIPLAHGFARGASSASCRRALRSGKVMCATARAFPDAMFHVKQFMHCSATKEQMFHVKTSGRGTRSKTGLAFLGKSARRRAARMNR